MRHMLLAVALLIASPAYADDAMTVAQNIASKWQAAYNNGDAGKIADLYVQDAVHSDTGFVVQSTSATDARPNLTVAARGPGSELTAKVS